MKSLYESYWKMRVIGVRLRFGGHLWFWRPTQTQLQVTMKGSYAQIFNSDFITETYYILLICKIDCESRTNYMKMVGSNCRSYRPVT